MKKFIAVLFIFAVLFFSAIHFLIPNRINVIESIGVKANPEAVYRILLKDESWHRWWPGEKGNAADPLHYNEGAYSLVQKLFNSFLINISKANMVYNTELTMVPISVDSLQIQWKTDGGLATNPVEKLSRYTRTRTLSKDMGHILTGLKLFFDKEENVYGSVIKRAKVKDSVLVATKLLADHYPTSEEIYVLIDKLQKYIQKEGALATDYAMMHVDSTQNSYTTMIAIPTNKLLNGNNKDIFLKRMVLGNILMTEVKGGPQTTKQALKQLEYYVDDYKKVSPAIPYESLVTDRSKEKDTSKWITKVYYPIF